MRELQLRVESPKIRINGRVFDLRLSDLEIYEKTGALFGRFERFAAGPHTAAEILAAAGEAAALLEAILGEGAAAAIGGGQPVSLRLMVEWLGEIAREAADHYADAAEAEADAD